VTIMYELYSGADSIGHGGTVSIRTANKKRTKLYWPVTTTKAITKRLIVRLE